MTDLKPEDIAIIQARAASINLEIPPDFLRGVMDNTALLTSFADLLEHYPLADTCEAAGDYIP
ncbi:DUF4089 domain-containing protein [Acetobacter conturbans]|uniref:DUF4089 domain-containing protein n=1 Tax=Acetobacter conturbans TaxID=1737472 RepID=A0ABX0JZB2_9PROT|nr:DUF4089 domain-containing protein [Acetobacter conturbans]NHN87408.1 DUF4089 domain-containing protein [Acetobacter conturbans]